ncbi:MAG: cytochrome c oxidase assembly protein [Gemmatimonadales bacterium]
MTWWCSAQGTVWSWAWQFYPGVWLLVSLLIGAYLRVLAGHRWVGGSPIERSRVTSYALGVLALWAAADWPLGPLGAGYLMSVHMVQWLLFTLVAPPLLIHGVPPRLLSNIVLSRSVRRPARLLSRPLPAFAVFNSVLLATHLPAVVDQLKPYQLGSFAMDMLWLGSGLLLWWQVLAPVKELDPLPYAGRIVFLLANVFIPTVPAAFLTFADYPIYELYELAPRIGELSATRDQQIAGLVMKVGGGSMIFATASVLFFRWYREEEAGER